MKIFSAELNRFLPRFRIRYFELAAVLFFSLVAIFLLGNYFNVTVAKHHMDTAFLLDITESTRFKGEPVSSLLTATIDGSMTWSLFAPVVCDSELKPSSALYNVLDNHAYYAIFAISAFTHLFSAEAVLSYLNGFSFVAILLVANLFLRNNKISILNAGIFCLIVSLHPAWMFAATGDYYMDRFYMPLALSYLLGMHTLISSPNISFKRWVWVVVIIIGLAAAAMTERAAIMIGLASFAMLFIHWGRSGFSRKGRLVLTILGSISLVYAYWYIKFRFVGVSTGGTLADLPQQLLHVVDRFKAPLAQKMLIIFLATNVGFLGIFSFFAGWRAALVACMVLLPNIIVTIGGAELIGWSTHYHSMYFPILIYCSLIGFMNLNKNAWLTRYSLATGALFATPILFGLIYNPYDGSLHSPSAVNFNTGITRGAWDYYVNPLSPDRHIREQAAAYNSAIPHGAKVSTFEAMIPSIYRDRTIYYYPVGIDSADYVVLGKVSQPDGNFYYAGAVNYQGGAEQLDKCLNERLLRAGYKLDQPHVLIGNVAIFKRN